MKEIELREITYNPGYCDMRGAYHRMILKKDGEGAWVFLCHDREYHSAPTVSVTYAVSGEAVAALGEWIVQARILSLEKRPNSDDFVTDYSPWDFEIEYDKTVFGKTVRKYGRLLMYKRYSRRDEKRLAALRERFLALRGEKIADLISVGATLDYVIPDIDR